MDGVDNVLESVAILPLSFSREFVVTMREAVGTCRRLGLDPEAIHARAQDNALRASRGIMTEGQAETYAAMVRRLVDAIIDE